ncbi:MAG: hypothetical protein ACOCVP_03870 [Wenzhouxiangella sp.]
MFGPQRVGFDRRKPVHHPPQHPEQRGLEHRHRGGQQGHAQNIGPQALGPGPQKGQQAARRLNRLTVGVGINTGFEIAEHLGADRLKERQASHIARQRDDSKVSSHLDADAIVAVRLVSSQVSTGAIELMAHATAVKLQSTPADHA